MPDPAFVTYPDWIEDCLLWRKRVLTGMHAHWCFEWDGLPVDETTPEWPCGCERADASAAHAISDVMSLRGAAMSAPSQIERYRQYIVDAISMIRWLRARLEHAVIAWNYRRKRKGRP